MHSIDKPVQNINIIEIIDSQRWKELITSSINILIYQLKINFINYKISFYSNWHQTSYRRNNNNIEKWKFKGRICVRLFDSF